MTSLCSVHFEANKAVFNGCGYGALDDIWEGADAPCLWLMPPVYIDAVGTAFL